MHRIPITMLCSITCSIALRFLFTYHKLLSAIIFSSVTTVNILIQENLDLSNNTTTNVLGSISSTDIIFPWWYRSIWIKSISEIIGIYSQIDFILFDYIRKIKLMRRCQPVTPSQCQIGHWECFAAFKYSAHAFEQHLWCIAHKSRL